MRRHPTVLALLALGLVACTGPSSECPAGQVDVEGECAVVCNFVDDCPPALSCVQGACARVNTECRTNSDCTTPGTCETGTGSCAGGLCEYAFVDPGEGCDDRDDCTDDDTCRDGGICAGSLRVCATPPGPACVDTTTARVYAPTGICFDGDCSYASTTVACDSCPDCLEGCAFDIDGDGTPELIDAGTVDPQNGCAFCDPTAPTGWTEISCEQPPPANVCRVSVGVCEPTGADCLQGGCCRFDPIWPEGASGAAPRCALTGEDPNGNGTEDGGEIWSGRCDHDGRCTGCEQDLDCDDGNPCTADLCNGDACEQTDAIGGDCEVAIAGDGTCVSGPAGAVCRLDPGFRCVSDDDCAAGYCVCANDACTRQVCHETGCDTCTYDADGTGACTATSPGNPGEGCLEAGWACNAAGECEQGAGDLCVVDASCPSGNCECTDADCSARRCSDVDCPCQTNSDGDATCDGPLGDRLDDPEDSCGIATCNGAGSCYLAPGEPCAESSACDSGFCVCADDQCSSRVCHESGCAACTYDSDGIGACTQTPPGNRGQECSTAGVACNAAGACRAAPGEPCTDAGACASELCECADALCSAWRCSGAACDCGFNGDGDAVCDGFLDAGQDDVRDSCGIFTCDGGGRCGSWHAAVRLYQGADSVDTVAPALNAAGDVAVMWRQRDPADPDYTMYNVMTRRREGGTWLAQEQVSATGLPNPRYTTTDSARVVAALGGGAHDFAAIWRQWNGSNTSYWYSRLSGGAWSSAAQLPLCTGWHSPLPVLLGDGRIIAFCRANATFGRIEHGPAGWQSAWEHIDFPPYGAPEDLQGQTNAAGRTTLLFTTDYLELNYRYYATIWSVAFDGGWGAYKNVDGHPVDDELYFTGDPTGDSRNPRSVIDGSGNVTATWRRRADPDAPQALWGARCEGNVWGAPQQIGSSDEVIEHAMAVDGAGNVTVAWIEGGTPTRNVWAVRWSGSWGTPMPLETDNTGDASQVSVVVDDAGNATAFWRQYDGSVYNLWANRYDVAGGGWSGRALVVAGSSEVQVSPWRHYSSITASTDGAFAHLDGDTSLLWVKWDTARNEVTYWATRMREGDPLATTRIDGEVVVPLSATYPGVTGPFVVEQSDGTAAIVWQVKRAADYQIWFNELR